MRGTRRGQEEIIILQLPFHHYHNVNSFINKIMGNGKRFIEYEIIRRFELQGDYILLD
jgi:ribosomal protein S7